MNIDALLEKYEFRDSHGHPLSLCEEFLQLKHDIARQGNKMAFTPQQVEKLWQHQFGPWRELGDTESTLSYRMHPFTCANGNDHPFVAGDKGVLVPTVRGWICPFCDYTQDWAHDFMKNGEQS